MDSIAFSIFPPLPNREFAVSARDIAEFQKLSVEFVAEIFIKLRRARLTETTEGKNGGFCLAKRANQIRVLAVVHTID
ncbi:RrF2 family transcriptional regulator [Paraburkholderia fungorum]|uniref:RrF2 family transcriptional regulator n=1 Tax=Paraburkholderia fungorum TaxID=134537 RepID=UPI0038B70278